MATLTTPVASATVIAVSRVRVPATAPAKRPFARFLTTLLRALGAMHV